MKVKDIMTQNPICCAADTTIKEVAKMMLDHDCGEIPVVDNKKRPIGVITDRDIICRILAKGENPLQKQVSECMSQPCITITPETSIEVLCDVLEENQIRRIPVVNDHGSCCGIVSQADIATHDLKEELIEVMEMVSQPCK